MHIQQEPISPGRQLFRPFVLITERDDIAVSDVESMKNRGPDRD